MECRCCPLLIAGGLLLLLSALAIELLNADRECVALRFVQRHTDVAVAARSHGRRLRLPPHADFCVRVPLFLDPALGPHWYHHGVEPAAAVAKLLHAPGALRTPLLNRSCLVVAPAALIRRIESNRMVRLLFESILTHGAFRVVGYAADVDVVGRDCVVGEKQHGKKAAFDWKDLVMVKVLAASRAAFHATCGRSPPRSSGSSSGGIGARAIIYQRDYSRRISNVAELSRALSRAYGGAEHVSLVTHDESRAPCELVRLVASSELWLSMHGFNSILAFLLPRRALFVEVFPDDYYVNHYYYANLASLNGVATRQLHQPGRTPSAWCHPLPWLVVHAFRHLPTCALDDGGFGRWRGVVEFLRMMQRSGLRMQDVAVNVSLVAASVTTHLQQLGKAGPLQQRQPLPPARKDALALEGGHAPDHHVGRGASSGGGGTAAVHSPAVQLRPRHQNKTSNASKQDEQRA